MASVLEYLTAEVLELAADAAKQNNRVRVTPRHVLLAIEQDDELRSVFKPKGTCIAGAGVVPFIHKQLLKIKTAPKKKKSIVEEKEDATNIDEEEDAADVSMEV